jgi:hypothetical protein
MRQRIVFAASVVGLLLLLAFAWACIIAATGWNPGPSGGPYTTPSESR